VGVYGFIAYVTRKLSVSFIAFSCPLPTSLAVVSNAYFCFPGYKKCGWVHPEYMDSKAKKIIITRAELASIIYQLSMEEESVEVPYRVFLLKLL
jgi:hypothetical protein